MSFRWTETKRLILECLDRPRFRGDVVRMLKKNPTTVSISLDRLWRQGLVLRSRDRVSVSYVGGKPGVGKVWRKFQGYLWVRRDSPMVTPSGIVEVELPETERYTLEQRVKRANIPFVEFREERMERKLSQDGVVDFLKSRGMGAVSREVATFFGTETARATNILEKLRRRGILERHGYWNPTLARETPFRGAIQGYVYGLSGTDQAKSRIEEGRGLYSPHAQAMYVEIEKDGRLGRFTPYRKFMEDWNLGEYEALNAIKILTRIYPSLTTTVIGSTGFVYDSRLLQPEAVDRQTRFWEDRISKRKMMAGVIGAFHESFVQKAVDLTLKDLSIKVTFWRRISKGKEWYDIRLSNGKQVDRVAQIDYLCRDKLLWTHLFPIEAKYYRGGIRPDHIQEFVDKLRTSYEFGETVDLQEGVQKLRVHVVKQNVFPLFIAPSYAKETYRVAKSLGVELFPTWLLSKLAGDKVGRKLDVKDLFKEYVKQGGKIETFISEAFTK